MQQTTAIPPRKEIEEGIVQLIQENRANCLWFVAPTFLPSTDEERLNTLANIERYGNGKAFKRARELKEWLLQAHS